MRGDYRWSPIQDLPENLAGLSDGELKPLIEVWTEQRGALDATAVEEFRLRLHREWAIETGIIEGAYTLPRGITETLIERGINAAYIPHDSDKNHAPAEIAAMIQDHVDALEGLFAFVKGERALTTSYIKELHSALMRHVDTYRVRDHFGNFFDGRLQKGAYKTQPNNPKRNGFTHEYCPPEQVASEMDRLVALHQEHVQRGVPPEIEAAWVHHALTQIHPFQDGNGRVARTLATLGFIRAGSFPLVVRDVDRDLYISALEAADAGNLAPLVAAFVRFQRRALIGGIHAMPEALRQPPLGVEAKTVDQAIAVAREALASKGEIGRKEWLHAKELAQRLHANILVPRMAGVITRMQTEIGAHGRSVQVTGAEQLLIPEQLPRTLGYEANPNEWSSYRGLRIRRQPGPETRIVTLLHAIGRKYRGVVAGLTVMARGDEPPALVSEDMFQVNYRDSEEAAQRRFGTWLEQSLARAITMWRQTL
jgi:Fic family protein